MAFFEDTENIELIEEIADTLVCEACAIIKEKCIFNEESERTRILIDVTEMILHKLVSVYPVVEPLDSCDALIDTLIDALEERKYHVPKNFYDSVVN